MRQFYIAAVVYLLLNLLLPTLWERVVSAAPEWVLTLVIYGGTILCLVAIVFSDPIYSRLSHPADHPISSTAIVSGLLAALVASTWWFIVLPRTKPSVPKQDIAFMATGSTAEYVSGIVRAGIAWSPRYGEVRLTVANSTAQPIEDLHLMMRPDEPVVVVTQEGNIPGVSIAVSGEPTASLELVNPKTGKRQAIPVALRATDNGITAVCQRLPGRGRLHFLFAIARVIEKVDNPKPGIDQRYVLTISLSNGAKLWYGFNTDEIFETTRRSASIIRVETEYTLNGKRQTFAQDIKVLDMIADSIRDGFQPRS